MVTTSNEAKFGKVTIAEPQLLGVYNYWKSKRGVRWAPSRADIDPVELRALLPFVYLIDVQHNPIQFRMRLVGTHVREFAGQDFTGRVIDETIYGPHAKEAIERLVLITEIKKPLHLQGRVVYEGQGSWQRFEALQLPLSSDNKTVDMILGANFSVEITSYADEVAPIASLDEFDICFMDEQA